MRALFAALSLLVAGHAGAKTASVPLDAFLEPAEVESIRLSPDGRMLAVVSSGKDRGGITLVDTQTLAVKRVWALARDNYAHSLQWIDAERFVFETRYDFDDRLVGQFKLEGLYLLDASRKEPERFRLDVNETLRVLPPSRGNAKARLLIEGFDNARDALFALDPDGGGRDRIAVGPAAMSGHFVLDREGDARYFVGENWKRERVILSRDGEEWKTLHVGHADDEARIPQRVAADGRRVYFIGPTPQGTLGLELFDPADNSFAWVSKDPRYDVTALVESTDGAEVIAVAYAGDRPSYHFIQPAHPDTPVYKELLRSFPGSDVEFVNVSRDGRWMLLSAASDRDPGRLYLFDREKKQASSLMRVRPAIDPERMAEQIPLRVKARDGLEIDAYVWVPAGKQAKGLPLVVRPHGGPYAERDVWAFDAEAQLLASRGYAVLAVNFRGSGGYGPGFRKRGYRQWGGTMIDDITDAVRWAVAEGIVDVDRVCIYGVSYGAFAALMSAAREPALYRCAAGMSGVYDINSMFRSDRRQSAWAGNYLEEIFPETVEERERQSPTTQAAAIRAAVLLAHGGSDPVTPLDQYQRMSRALERAGHPAEVEIYHKPEGHGFRIPEHRKDFYEQLLTFLDKHIGEKRAVADKD